MKQLVMASGNANKLQEVRQLLAGTAIHLIGLDELPDPPKLCEPFDTFAENARHKAVVVAHHSALPALADDSGLVVEALDGRPGVHSSRYGQTDQERIERLLAELVDVPTERRAAHFACVLALAHGDNIIGMWEGVTEGIITAEPHGASGFGYDPVFYYPPLGLTFAEMLPDQKNSVSHRGHALRAMSGQLPQLLAALA
jgi:XTP/dITP diphosphohydrolase